MILKASTRKDARALGRHLLNDRDNDHVEVHEVSGFLSNDVPGAMAELDATAKNVKSRQPIFSVSLSPPKDKEVGIEVFERAIREIEERNGLSGQPRIVIFHEKDARRHCHAAWSRLDAETMTVKPLPFYKTKLRDLAKSIYLAEGWELPRGFIDARERDPRSFNLAEWQQCKRLGKDPRQLKMLAQESWAISDDAASFARALEQRGLYLARGDRRSHVALTVEGEPFAIPKLLDKRTKEVRARLGEGDALRGVDATRAYIAQTVMPKLGALIERTDAEKVQALAPLDQRRAAMRLAHRSERELMDIGVKARAEAEIMARAERLRSGLAGLWDRLTGEYRRQRERNEREAWASVQRDRAQRSTLIIDQLAERGSLQRQIAQIRAEHAARLVELHRDLSRQREARDQFEDTPLRENFQPAQDAQERRDALRAMIERPSEPRARAERAPRERNRGAERDFGFEP